MNKKFLVSYLILFLLFHGCSEKPISEKQKAINAYKEKQSKPHITNSQPGGIEDIEEEIPLTFYKKGVEYASQGKFEKAKEQFNEALDIYKFNPAVIEILAILKDVNVGIIDKNYASCLFKAEDYGLDGNTRQAIEEFQKAIQMNPKLAYAYDKLGAIYIYLGDYQQAVFCGQKAIQIDPNNLEYLYALGSTYNLLGEPQKAIAELRKVIEINPDYYWAYVGFGHVYSSIEKHQQAIAEFQKAIQINPGISDAYAGLGVAFHSLGQHKKSITYNQKAIQINPGDGAAYAGLGINYFYLGKFRQAIPYLQRSIQINPVFPEPHYGLGLAYFSLGQYREAKEAFQKVKGLFQCRENYEMVQKVEEYLITIEELIKE